MNAITYLGIQVVRTCGEKLLPSLPSQPEVASVSVVQAVTIPGEKGCFVSAKVHGEQQVICCLNLITHYRN